MNLLEKKEVKEYREFRKLIFSGPLYILKHEYIHILYKLYIRIIRSIFKHFMVKKDNSSSQRKTQTKEVLFSFKKDYTFSLKYMKEIHYLETVYDGNFSYESLKKDEKIMKIMNPNYRIIISKYAFDVLLTYIERLDFSFLQDTILTRDKNKLLVSQNLLTESYINQCYIDDEKNITDIDLINSCNYIIGMLRDNYNFLIKLEEIIYRKSHPDEKAIEVELENKFPIEKSSATFLSNCPEYKNKFLVDLAKNYINRRIITKNKLASVLELKFDDPDGKVTVVEFSRTLKLVLIGTIDGIIKSYLFFQDGEVEETTETPDKKKFGETPYNLLKENIKNQKFSIETESIKYIGHKGAITTLSLAFDSSYFISGGSDGDIRLWNTMSGTCLAVFKAHIKTIWNVKIAYRGYYFASSCDDGIILLWATNKYTPLKNFIGHTGEISCLEFSKNMIYLISASYDLSVRVWNIDEQDIVRIFFFDSVVMSLEVNEVGTILVCGDEEGVISVWNINKGYILMKFNFCEERKNKKIIRGINLSFDEDSILIYNCDTLAYYNFKSFKEEFSKDVFKKNEQDVSEKENLKVIEPYQVINIKSHSFFKVLFNQRNLIVAFNK